MVALVDSVGCLDFGSHKGQIGDPPRGWGLFAGAQPTTLQFIYEGYGGDAQLALICTNFGKTGSPCRDLLQLSNQAFNNVKAALPKFRFADINARSSKNVFGG